MTFNTLNSRQLTSKSGNLSIALYPNLLGKKYGTGKNYYARVVNRSLLSMEDIADDMVSNGFEMDRDDIVSFWRKVNNAVIARLSEGIGVSCNLGTFRLGVVGTFETAQSAYSRANNKIVVNYKPSKELVQKMNTLTPVVTCGKKTDVEIISVQNLANPGSDVFSAGDYMRLTGKNLRVLSDKDGADKGVGVFFVSEDGTEVACKSALFHNEAQLLEFVVPEGLESGHCYCVKVRTYFGGSSVPRVSAIEGVSEKPIMAA